MFPNEFRGTFLRHRTRTACSLIRQSYLAEHQYIALVRKPYCRGGTTLHSSEIEGSSVREQLRLQRLRNKSSKSLSKFIVIRKSRTIFYFTEAYFYKNTPIFGLIEFARSASPLCKKSNGLQKLSKVLVVVKFTF